MFLLPYIPGIAPRGTEGTRACQENGPTRHEVHTRDSALSSRALRPRTRGSTRGPRGRARGLMGDELAELAHSQRCDGTFCRVNRLLAAGASDPQAEAAADELDGMARARPEGLAKVNAMLEAGSAEVVERVEEFYNIGMPVGLHGGLAALCMAKREEVRTPAVTTTRPGGEVATFPADYLVATYKRFWKGDGWIGCAGLHIAEGDVVFFYMRRRGTPQQAAELVPSFGPTDPPRVKPDTLNKIGFNGVDGSFVARTQVHRNRLDPPDRGPRHIDQRNVPIASISITPRAADLCCAGIAINIVPAMGGQNIAHTAADYTHI
jgi:hypothetical protein